MFHPNGFEENLVMPRLTFAVTLSHVRNETREDAAGIKCVALIMAVAGLLEDPLLSW